MTIEPCLDGKSKIEIDESEFITSDGSVRWMFGLVYRAKYDIRIFYIDDNRQKKTLLPIVKKMYILFLIEYIIMKMEII